MKSNNLKINNFIRNILRQSLIMRKEQAHTSKGSGAPIPKSDFNKDA